MNFIAQKQDENEVVINHQPFTHVKWNECSTFFQVLMLYRVAQAHLQAIRSM